MIDLCDDDDDVEIMARPAEFGIAQVDDPVIDLCDSSDDNTLLPANKLPK